MDSAACKGLGIGQNVTFEVSIEVTECPVNREEWSKDLKIYPVGLTESLIVHLDLICECDCEQPSEEVRACVCVRASVSMTCARQCAPLCVLRMSSCSCD